MNKVLLLGHLGADPEITYTKGGTCVATLSIATNERWTDKQTGEKQEKTEWHRVVSFGKPAEVMRQYCKKGAKLLVEGKLQTRQYTDKSGIERWITETIVQDFKMLDSKQNAESITNTPF